MQGASQPGSARRGDLPKYVKPVIIVLAAGLFAILGVRLLPPLGILEANLADRVRIAMAAPGAAQDPRISVIVIDEATMATLPYRSPVDRGLLADVVGIAGSAGARAIGLDILLDQPTEAEKDLRLAAALGGFAGTKVLAWADARSGMTEAQSAWLDEFRAASGASFGFANLVSSADGVVRYHASALPGTDVPSFADALTGAPDGGAGARWLIDWRQPSADGAPPFQTTPAHVLPLLRGNADLLRAWFRDRIVLIGADLPQQDRHLTPLGLAAPDGGLTPGVMIHAHVIAQILDGVRVPVLPAWAGWAVAPALGLLAALIALVRLPLAAKLALMALLIVGYGAALVGIASAGGPVLPAVAPVLAAGLAFAATASLDAWQAHRERAFVRNAFSHYLAPALVDRLVAHPETLTLGGERREMSFLFTDIAGFTSMSERMDPEELTALLNDYLDGMSEIVMRHHGVVDKYIGDAVVGLFGVPEPDPAHAARAILCARDLDAFAEAFRAGIPGSPLGVTRIGVHTGVATVGNFGGRARFDYTAIGDAMNTAARLEGANKAFGTRIAISAATIGHAEAAMIGDIPLQTIGDIVLKGKDEAVTVSTIKQDAGRDWLDGYRRAYAALGNGAGDAASCLRALEPDPVVAFHLGRIARNETGTRIELTEK